MGDTRAGSARPSASLPLAVGVARRSGLRLDQSLLDRVLDQLRFAVQVSCPRPSHAIILLDSDAKGMIYLGVAAGDPGEANIVCLDPGDGHVAGRVVLPLSHSPEESFRDFTVGDDGTIAFAVRGDDGIEYRTSHCP